MQLYKQIEQGYFKYTQYYHAIVLTIWVAMAMNTCLICRLKKKRNREKVKDEFACVVLGVEFEIVWLAISLYQQINIMRLIMNE